MFFQVSDVLAIAKIAWQVYDIGFSKYRNARQEYVDFGNDVRHFCDALNSLADAIQRARRSAPQIRDDEWSLGSLRDIVGDFQTTIKRCEELIDQNPDFEKDRSGFVQNIKWSLGMAEAVRSLRSRISFHCSKILFVIKPLEIKLYADIAQRLNAMEHRLVGKLDEIKGILLGNERDEIELEDTPSAEVPSYLSERFRNRAAQARDIEPFPMAEGVDALAFHLKESTLNFRPFSMHMRTPEPLQYLNLMKCIWILERIKTAAEFKEVCKETLWKEYINALEVRILVEWARFTDQQMPLQPPSQNDILREPDSNFSIWVNFCDADPFPTLTEPDGVEQKIFDASLPDISQNRKQDIMVFRLGETQRIRLVRVVTSVISKQKEIEGHEIDAERVILLPFYAYPQRQDPALSIAWRSTSADQRSQGLTFNDVEDIHKLQQAITNFAVVHDGGGLTKVRIKDSSIGAVRVLGDIGRAQIWIHRQPTESPSGSNGSTIRRQETRTSDGRQDSATSPSFSSPSGPLKAQSWAREYAESINPYSEMQQSGRLSLLRRPVPSRVVVFSSLNVNGRRHVRFISIPVTENTQLQPTRCDCYRNPKGCTRVILDSTKGKLPVDIHDTKGRDEKWNLAVLRWPAHSDFEESVEKRNAKFIELTFDTVQQRINFTGTFAMASDNIRASVASYVRDKGNIRAQHIVSYR